jgi:hypothetical protein
VTGNRPMVESAIGERAAEPFVEEEEEQRNLHAFRRETIGVSRSVTLQRSMALSLRRS